ncbi:unnamed protein product [Vicia faba]|uniref:DNA-directed RNA polymerase III subunit RPC3 n=1 Tax=Vicia faba TaxID=3906 RepID=A0AAV1A5D9_VICFA|nr:unnamed protein product [Vicia faba]
MEQWRLEKMYLLERCMLLLLPCWKPGTVEKMHLPEPLRPGGARYPRPGIAAIAPAIFSPPLHPCARAAGLRSALERRDSGRYGLPLPLDTIFSEVIKTENGRTMTIDRVRASLVQLGCSNQMLYEYIVDLKHIIRWARNEEVESIVLKRYGRDAYRMFRHLSKENQFCPTDKLADATLVEKKEAPKLLFQLWKENFLHMEKLSVTGANTKPVLILMWKVNQPLLWENVLDEMYHGALNLKLRMAFEQEKEEEIINTPKAKINESVPLLKKYKRLQNVLLLLGSSLMKLDDALMLFHDF